MIPLYIIPRSQQEQQPWGGNRAVVRAVVGSEVLLSGSFSQNFQVCQVFIHDCLFYILKFCKFRNICVSSLWDSLNCPVCTVFEDKGKLFHHQLGVKLKLTAKEKKYKKTFLTSDGVLECCWASSCQVESPEDISTPLSLWPWLPLESFPGGR